jgi:acetyl esterase/lipase
MPTDHQDGSRSRTTSDSVWHTDFVVARPEGYRPLEFDLRIPLGAGPWPVLFWIHGGAWRGGSRRDAPPGAPAIDLRDRLIERGFAVGMVDYRLSHEAVYPAQLQDIRAAIDWARENSARFGLDAGRFALMGDSAGGHLAALAGLATAPAVGVHAVVDWYGPTDLTFPDGPPESGDPAIPLFGGLPHEFPDVARSASPLYQVHRDSPPFLCVHGELDRNVPPSHSERLVAALAAAGVRAEVLIVSGAGHGFAGVAELGWIIDRSIDFLVDVLDYDTAHREASRSIPSGSLEQ